MSNICSKIEQNQVVTALEMAEAVKSQEITAQDIIKCTLAKINRYNDQLNCFTKITAIAAMAQAKQIDAQIALRQDPGPLAGVPFAVKNLFDIAGLTTLAGSKINRDNPLATHDATAIAKLKSAGAILVGALNMDEYAYGFVTENSHYGTTPNPHDATKIAGGSSGGSAAAVAASLVPFSLGSDTNGSIRVPAALCGIYGFKPTYGRLSRAGTFLFSHSLDHIGPMARTVEDIATVYDLLQGYDSKDPVSTGEPPNPTMPLLDKGIQHLRIAVADQYFDQGAAPEAIAAVEQVAKALNVTDTITLPESDRARAAASIITASEGARIHLNNLRIRPQDFDPATRDRFFAGALIPAVWYHQAQRFRRWYRSQLQQTFQEVDIILAPTTPCVAPDIGQTKIAVADEEMLVRSNLGRFTAPLSFIGLPVLSVPLVRDGLPLGVQLIAAPYQELAILQVAKFLEHGGVVSTSIAPLPTSEAPVEVRGQK